MEPCGHSDRVAWYRWLIEVWTCRVPYLTMVGDAVVAGVEPYCAVEGIWHMQTEVCAGSVEAALEQLACVAYASWLEDVRQVVRAC